MQKSYRHQRLFLWQSVIARVCVHLCVRMSRANYKYIFWAEKATIIIPLTRDNEISVAFVTLCIKLWRNIRIQRLVDGFQLYFHLRKTGRTQVSHRHRRVCYNTCYSWVNLLKWNKWVAPSQGCNVICNVKCNKEGFGSGGYLTTWSYFVSVLFTKQVWASLHVCVTAAVIFLCTGGVKHSCSMFVSRVSSRCYFHASSEIQVTFRRL